MNKVSPAAESASPDDLGPPQPSLWEAVGEPLVEPVETAPLSPKPARTRKQSLAPDPSDPTVETMIAAMQAPATATPATATPATATSQDLAVAEPTSSTPSPDPMAYPDVPARREPTSPSRWGTPKDSPEATSSPSPTPVSPTNAPALATPSEPELDPTPAAPSSLASFLASLHSS